MAKSKLSSIKDNPTITKLEMNTLTMAARLSNAIFSALQKRVPIKEITIYSDSEIALGWIKNTKLDAKVVQSHLPDESKFPILFGAQSDLASLIIKDAHATFHLGTAHTITRIREKFRIPQLRRQVQKILRRCVPFQRINNLPYRYQEMPDLPARRVTPSTPCLHVDIDYFGPFTVRSATFLRLHYQEQPVEEIRLQWSKLQLQCENPTIAFTRRTQQKALDAKRCAHIGCCVDEKCAGTNSTALVPKLYQANHLPLTFCVESCRGPGCGPFYMSSGRLFYQIYAQPNNDDILIFRRSRWNEVIVNVKVMNSTKKLKHPRARLLPTIPQDIDYMNLKISTLNQTVPPSPTHQALLISYCAVEESIYHQYCSARHTRMQKLCSATYTRTVDAIRQSPQ
ncbi:unnamed protein product [Heligmosomoides polygyrus]|uniref:RNase H domain-containing protein n=1 Tax=Heligmosomoides polygyrus TaxID=6339 RepID=A0A183GGH4_HELPZ|nr:unnamed protein product [Heligmosomoides polygyrus]